MRLLSAVVLAGSAVAALAQGPGSGEPRTPAPAPPLRQPAPPAAKGSPLPESAAPADNRSREAASRCAELTGTMREQCLLEHGSGASGASAAGPEPRTAPPPQNPR